MRDAIVEMFIFTTVKQFRLTQKKLISSEYTVPGQAVKIVREMRIQLTYVKSSIFKTTKKYYWIISTAA